MPKLCPDCHHLPSGRTADHGACYCRCHDSADAAPELLAACKRAADFLELDKHAAGDTLARLYAAIAAAESHS